LPALPRIVPFEPGHAAAAGAMLAARHARERLQFPLLDPRYEDGTACEALVAAALDYADGVAALDPGSGALAGFLSGVQNLPDPASPSARYAPERSSMLIAHGHALAPGADAGLVYHALFAALAEQYRSANITDHFAHVPAGDSRVEAAWAMLGFGRANAVAIRDLRPLDDLPSGKVSIREATPEDLDIVDRLVDEEARYHAGSPIFRPYLRDQTRESVRAAIGESLDASDRVHLLARVNGADMGVIEIGPARGSPLYIPEGAAYIGDTAVLDRYRGIGVGAALVDAAMGWGRDRGYRAATLHFAAANALSTSFWTGLGFEPAMWHLRRRLDERITWAQPPRAVQ
jgi:GNAT superfamily N-acetyltransferase